MKWSIFSRLVTGYLGLLLLSTGVSIYAIFQLRYVRDVTNSVIMVDNALLDLHKNLSDSLLSEQRYEKKYIIMQDDALYARFLNSNSDFEKHLVDAGRIAATAELKSVLARVAELHTAYQALVNHEARRVRVGRPYADARYRDEKQRTVNSLIDELTKLRSLSQHNIFDKVKLLSKAGTRATRVAMFTSAAALAAGIMLSVLITAGITRPLSEMKRKMTEFSNGIREAGLTIDSPPEIAALARSFNFMCGKLNELDKLKNDFYALMSHELRTPLSSIKESASLFLEGRVGSVSEKQKRLVTIIAEESNRLIDLVNSLLDISKLEAGMVTYDISRTPLNPLILKVVNEVLPLAEAKRIRIEKKLQESPVLFIDSERILQVLRNLIGNALKFTPRDGLISISSSLNEKGFSISVSDTGPGISREHAAIIFDKYRQAAVPGSHDIQGTGLGLAIVNHIIHGHGGTVWVESDGKNGSTFTFVLPLSSSAQFHADRSLP